MTEVAIVGAAGTGPEAGLLRKADYERMRMMAESLVRRAGPGTSLRAGGTPWAGHVAVGLVVGKVLPAARLTLATAAPFVDGAFEGPLAAAHAAAHRAFRTATGIDSIGEIEEAADLGAVVAARDGRADRDAFLGGADLVLAFAFSDAPKWTVRVASGTPAAAMGIVGRPTRAAWDRGACRALVSLGPLGAGDAA